MCCSTLTVYIVFLTLYDKRRNPVFHKIR